MSEQEKTELREKICNKLKESYKSLLQHKAALGLDIVTGDDNGQPVIVSAKSQLEKFS